MDATKGSDLKLWVVHLEVTYCMDAANGDDAVVCALNMLESDATPDSVDIIDAYVDGERE